MSTPDKITGEELTIEFSPEVQAQIDADPKLAAAMREFSAQMRQAQQDVHDGKYADMEEALEAMGATQVAPPEDDAG